MRPQFLVVAVVVCLCVNYPHIVTASFKVSSDQNTVDISTTKIIFRTVVTNIIINLKKCMQ